MPYNPFPKQLHSPLTVEDLELLISNEVAEGYFVEYKSTFPQNRKIARSIASLANTYGGWYFVGIQEENLIARELCGISLAEFSDPVAKLRDTIKSRMDPTPLFFSQMVEIGDEKAVLAVYVPGDQETPYITDDGRIYRRVADSSEPVPERERSTVDRLVDRGRNVARGFADFCHDERTFSKAEEDAIWLQVFISPYPLQKQDTVDLDGLGKDTLIKLLDLSRTRIPIPVPGLKLGALEGNLPFTLAQPTDRSIILRHIAFGDGSMNSLELELFLNGRAKLLIPIQEIDFTADDLSSARNPDAQNEVHLFLSRSPHSYLRFVDMIILWQAVSVLTSFYLTHSATIIDKHDLIWAARLRGTWRTVPFFDTRSWAEHVRSCGLPIIMKDDIFIGDPLESKRVLSEEHRSGLWMNIVGNISLAMGLPLDFVDEDVVSAFQTGTESS